MAPCEQVTSALAILFNCRQKQSTVKTLQGDEAKLPSHILQKVNERIQRACKKNAALSIEYYEGLHGKLEFFDLREVQDTLTSKLLWPAYEKLFGSKETLNTKFDQLAELRNCLRHSRSVNEVVQKEGEAAIIWFTTLLGK